MGNSSFQITALIYTGGTAAGIPLALPASIFCMHVNSSSLFLSLVIPLQEQHKTHLTFFFLLCTATEIEIAVMKFTRNSMAASPLWFWPGQAHIACLSGTLHCFRYDLYTVWGRQVILEMKAKCLICRSWGRYMWDTSGMRGVNIIMSFFTHQSLSKSLN